MTQRDMPKGPDDDEPAEELDIEDIDFIEESEDVDVSREASGVETGRRLEWQKVEMVRGQIDGFSPSVSVQFEMRKDLDKRGGDEPGEDMFLADRKTGLSGVLDGLGGEGAGDKASAVAADVLPKAYEAAMTRLKKASEDPAELALHMRDFLEGQVAFVHPNEKEHVRKAWDRQRMSGTVITEAIALREAALSAHKKVKETGGNTTLTVGKTVEDASGKRYEIIVNSGDSGAFRIKADGTVENLTREDSVIDLLIARGMLTREQSADPNHVVAGKSVRKWRSAMFQALGMDENKVGAPFQPRVSVTKLEPGDRVVYLSDGIRDLEKFQTSGQFDPEKAAEVLKDAAPNANLASLLAETAAQDERVMKETWGTEMARAKIEGREPDVRKKPKLDEKTALVKQISEPRKSEKPSEEEEEIIELDESDLLEEIL